MRSYLNTRLKYLLIDDMKSMSSMIKQVAKDPIIALDIEGNGRHRYPERICLMQLASATRIYIVDPIAKIDMTPLCELIENQDVIKVMHSVSYDVRCLRREWGITINNLFDAAIAASFLGLKKTGLATVIQEILEIKIEKSKTLQRSDWTIRPLNKESVLYAATDVAHLINLRSELTKRLKAIGRYDWVQEECQRQVTATFKSTDPEIDFFSVKGSGILDPPQMSVLKSLSKLRIKHAVFRDKPLYKILTDKTLVELAQANPSMPLSLDNLGPFAFQPLKTELLTAIKNGLNAPPVSRPRTARRSVMNLVQKKRLELLKSWRRDLGSSLEIDPSLVWPTASLERIARDITTLKTEPHSVEVRNWQTKKFLENMYGFIHKHGLNERAIKE